MKLVTNGDIDFAVTFASEVNDPGVEVVGPLPKAISDVEPWSRFHRPREIARSRQGRFLSHLSSPAAAAAYREAAMQVGR